jgi:hypothetical protein
VPAERAAPVAALNALVRHSQRLKQNTLLQAQLLLLFFS